MLVLNSQSNCQLSKPFFLGYLTQYVATPLQNCTLHFINARATIYRIYSRTYDSQCRLGYLQSNERTHHHRARHRPPPQLSAPLVRTQTASPLGIKIETKVSSYCTINSLGRQTLPKKPAMSLHLKF